MVAVFDTSMVADVLRGRPEAIRAFERVDEVGVPFVVYAELLTGTIRSMRTDHEKFALYELLRRPHVRLLWPDEQKCNLYAVVLCRLAERGLPIPTNDIWIAATALKYEAILVTRDRHFDLVERLQVCAPDDV